MKGISNILIVLAWALDTFMDFKESKADDGKINFKDVPRFLDNITRVPSLVKAAPEVLEEALDLDGDEAEQIAILVMEKTGVQRAEVKTVIAKALNATYATSEWLKSGFDLADSIKALKG